MRLLGSSACPSIGAAPPPGYLQPPLSDVVCRQMPPSAPRARRPLHAVSRLLRVERGGFAAGARAGVARPGAAASGVATGLQGGCREAAGARPESVGGPAAVQSDGAAAEVAAAATTAPRPKQPRSGGAGPLPGVVPQPWGSCPRTGGYGLRRGRDKPRFVAEAAARRTSAGAATKSRADGASMPAGRSVAAVLGPASSITTITAELMTTNMSQRMCSLETQETIFVTKIWLTNWSRMHRLLVATVAGHRLLELEGHRLPKKKDDLTISHTSNTMEITTPWRF